MKKTWGLLLVAVALVMGSCTKENDEPAPAPTFEWTTDITTDGPVFVVPDTKVEMAYAAEHVQTVTVEALPSGWSVSVDQNARKIELSATADATTNATLKLTVAGSRGADSFAKCEAVLFEQFRQSGRCLCAQRGEHDNRERFAHLDFARGICTGRRLQGSQRDGTG